MYITEANNMAPMRVPIFDFDIGSSKYNRKYVKGMKKSPRDTRCFMLTVFHIDGVEMQINIEKKMLGMKNRFFISDSISQHYHFFDTDRVEMQRNIEKKMLGMKNRFDISGNNYHLCRSDFSYAKQT